MDFCTYDHILDTTWITDKKLLQFKLSKSGQILCVDIKDWFSQARSQLMLEKVQRRATKFILGDYSMD